MTEDTNRLSETEKQLDVNCKIDPQTNTIEPTKEIRSGFCQVIECDDNMEKNIPHLSTNQPIIEIDKDDKNKLSFDNGDESDLEDIESLKIDENHLESDNYLGVPTFSDNELSIIQNNLMMDTSIIDYNKVIMKSSLESINSLKDIINLSEEDKKLLNSSYNTYKSARNLLIQYKNSILEYYNFIDENKHEILGDLKIESSELIKKYIESTSKEFDLTYTDNSLMFYITAVAIKRAIKNIENDSIYKILTLKHSNDFDVNFEKEIYNILKPEVFLISNVSNHFDQNKMSSIERDTLKMMTNIVTRFRKISSFDTEQNEKCTKIIGSSRGIFVSFLFKLSMIIGKKFYFDFRNEKHEYNTEMNKILKKIKKDKSISHMKYKPFQDNFIKTRLSLYMVEFYIKKLFSLSLFGDQKILDKKESFLNIIDNMDATFKSVEIIQGLINTFSFKLIFNEITNIFQFVDNNKYTNNIRRSNMLKSYLTFIAYHKVSTVYKDYNFKELYTEYFNTLLNKIESFVNK